MSIIFQTLQKLSTRTESEQETEVAGVPVQEARPRGLAVRMGLVSAGVVVLVLLGYGSVVGVRYLSSQAAQGEFRNTAVRKAPSFSGEIGGRTSPAIHDAQSPVVKTQSAYYPPQPKDVGTENSASRPAAPPAPPAPGNGKAMAFDTRRRCLPVKTHCLKKKNSSRLGVTRPGMPPVRRF